MQKHEKYPLFNHWYKTLNWILDKCDKMPKHIRFSLSGRIAQLSLDIMEGIVEAIYNPNRNEILQRTNLQLEKLRILFRICHERRYINHNQYVFGSGEMISCGKMLGGWKKSHAQS